MSTQGIATRISVIEAMRGLAAISVALFHFADRLSTDIAVGIQQIAWLGLDVFFVISGFVIPLSLYGKNYRLAQFPAFMLRRLIRLEPPYLMSIVLVIVLWHVNAMLLGPTAKDAGYSIGQILAHLFYLIPLTSFEWLHPVYWSLAYEFAFYILVGLTFSTLIDRPVWWTAALGASITSLAGSLTGAIDVRMLEFLVGALAMRLVVDAPQRAQATAALIITLAVVLVADDPKIGVAVILATGAILAFREVRLGAWATVIGGFSYSLYLTHASIGGRVVSLGKRFGEGAAYEACLMLLALLVSIVFAAMFAYMFERPALRASRTIGSTVADGGWRGAFGLARRPTEQGLGTPTTVGR